MASPMDFASCAALLKTDVLPGSRGSVCSPHRSVKGVTTHIIPYIVYYVLQRIPATLRSRGHILAGSGKNLVPLMAGTFFRRRPLSALFIPASSGEHRCPKNQPFGAKQ